MSNNFNQPTEKTSIALFEGLFIIAALVAAFATFVAISGVDPDRPGSGATPWLLGLNGFVIIALIIIVTREFLAISGLNNGEGKGRLAKRFIMLFGFSALMPAMIVAIFLGAVITRGLDNWLGERVETVMEQNTQLFQGYVDSFEDTFEMDVRLAALDIENFSREANASLNDRLLERAGAEPNRSAEVSQEFSEGLRSTLAYREFLTIALLGADGVELVAEESIGEPVLVPPPTRDFEEAKAGDIGMTLYRNRGIQTAIIRINEPVDGYVYAAKSFDGNLVEMLRDTQGQLVQYNNAKERSGRLQTIFVIGFAQITMLILLLATRFGLEAAGRITGPIGRLADAAHAVRDGNLQVRVPVTGPEDEVRALTTSFNTMTSQLATQRGELLQARAAEEDRRKFIETLLTEVSAGVMQVAPDLTVQIANRSAVELLDREDVPSGVSLSDVAPQFVIFAKDAIDRRASVDASIDIERAGEIRHVRLKAAPDSLGGCVLTFDDTTGLVNAQRQLAWRDVARRIAHEIRNPLTPIMLSTERIKRRYASKIDDHDGVFEKCIETILRQVGDIGRMVEEFSSFARMPKPNLEAFDLVALLETTSFSQSVVSPDLDIQFQTVMKSAIMSGDERLLGQAFGNLMKNAAEAIEGRPESIDTPGHIIVELESTTEGLEITIEDNGPGFPEQVRDKLLEPYVTTREKGTGLGLAIVNRIIADHGGAISLQNRPDGLSGARVRVRLPHVSPQQADTFEEIEDTILDGERTVELVDAEETSKWR